MFNTNAWDDGAKVEAVYMGAPPDYELEGEAGWDRPDEPIEINGCPSGYARSAFVLSLFPYRRQMDNNGNRIDHHAYTHCSDPFVIEALREMELAEGSAASDNYTIMSGGGDL